ncbi:hypothetical protein Tco_0434499 [Tanacetum coccineum]
MQTMKKTNALVCPDTSSQTQSYKHGLRDLEQCRTTLQGSHFRTHKQPAPTSSNSRTHATDDGHIVTEPVQRKAPGNVVIDRHCKRQQTCFKPIRGCNDSGREEAANAVVAVHGHLSSTSANKQSSQEKKISALYDLLPIFVVPLVELPLAKSLDLHAIGTYTKVLELEA